MDYCKAVYFRRVQNFHLLLYLKKNRENVFLLNKYMTGAVYGAGHAYPSEAPDVTPGFYGSSHC
jgi:hypothetical protein